MPGSPPALYRSFTCEESQNVKTNMGRCQVRCQPCTGRSPARRVKTLKSMWDNARFAASLVQVVHLRGELKPMWEDARFAASLVQVVQLRGELQPMWENARFAASLVQIVHLRGELQPMWEIPGSPPALYRSFTCEES